jgi:hypothetical protein
MLPFPAARSWSEERIQSTKVVLELEVEEVVEELVVDELVVEEEEGGLVDVLFTVESGELEAELESEILKKKRKKG